MAERVKVVSEDSDRSGSYTAIVQWTEFDGTEDLVVLDTQGRVTVFFGGR